MLQAKNITTAPNPNPAYPVRPSPSTPPTLSQNLLNLHTLPTPTLSSHLLTPSPISSTLPRQTPPTHRRKPSFTLSLSTARFLATSAGARLAFLLVVVEGGRHSGGSTALSTRDSIGGRAASRRESRMLTSERASCRDTTVVRVWKMRRRARSAREGRKGDQRRGGRRARARRRRWAWRIGARERERRRWEVCCLRLVG